MEHEANVSVDAPAVNVDVSTTEETVPVTEVVDNVENQQVPTVEVTSEDATQPPASPTTTTTAEDAAPTTTEDAAPPPAYPATTDDAAPPPAYPATPESPTPDAAPTPVKAAVETKTSSSGAYTLKELAPLGVEVQGVKLSEPLSDAIIKQLKEDVHKYKVLVFRDQGELTGERQLQVTEWFGEVETAGFELHDKSPDRRILRVSNDEAEGYVGFGTAGFHVDGSFMEKPNAHSIYHMVCAPADGETYFVSWSEVMNGMFRSKRHLWRRMSMLKTFKRIRGFQEEPGEVIHPVVYKHPVTGEATMCLSLGKLSRFIMDHKTQSERRMDKDETATFENDINTEIRRGDDALLYKHKWQSGDVIITDNLAVGHLASNGTQRSREEIGLRVLHRTITKGTFSPSEGHLAAKNQKCILM